MTKVEQDQVPRTRSQPIHQERVPFVNATAVGRSRMNVDQGYRAIAGGFCSYMSKEVPHATGNGIAQNQHTRQSWLISDKGESFGFAIGQEIIDQWTKIVVGPGTLIHGQAVPLRLTILVRSSI